MRRQIQLLAVTLALALAAACSQQQTVLPAVADSVPGKDLPFDRSAESDGLSPTRPYSVAALPVGTPVVIRLTFPMTSASVHSGDDFEAKLDVSIVVEGKSVVAEGTPVMGQVVTAKASNEREAGYLRLTVSSLAVNGRAYQIHTSSIFAKGRSRHKLASERDGLLPQSQVRSVSINDVSPATSLGSAENREARFSTDRRLTFHLLQSLSLEP